MDHGPGWMPQAAKNNNTHPNTASSLMFGGPTMQTDNTSDDTPALLDRD
jgi:hypothetical protein